MARRKLSREEEIQGCIKALQNPKTPKQFRAGLIKRLAQLRDAR